MNDPLRPENEPMRPPEAPIEEEVPGFFEENKVSILTGIGLVVLIILGFGGWQLAALNAREGAMTGFAEARNAEDFRRVADEYRGQPAAANALLEVSAIKRSEGDLAASDAALNEFIEDYPDHELVGTAMLGLAANREAGNDLDAAIDIYRQIPAKYSGSYAAPLARLGEARLLAVRGKEAESALVYEDVIANHPNTPAAMIARRGLAELDIPDRDTEASDGDAVAAAPADAAPEPTGDGDATPAAQ